MKKIYSVTVLGMILSMAWWATAVAPAIAAAPKASFPGTEHRTVTGTVERIKDGMVFVKTPTGADRTVSLKQIDEERISGLKVGDQLALKLNAGDTVIDIDRVGDSGRRLSERAERIVSGNLVAYDAPMKTVRLRRNDGSVKSFAMKEAAAGRMVDLKAGTALRLEIDRENGLVEDFQVARR